MPSPSVPAEATSNGAAPAEERELAPGEREIGSGMVVREEEHATVPMRIGRSSGNGGRPYPSLR